MTNRLRAVIVVVVVAAGAALVVVPVDATYLNEVGSDSVEYRTASCGAPVGSLLGADPELNGGSEFPIGGETSITACKAASGHRTIGSLVLLLAAAVASCFGRRRSI